MAGTFDGRMAHLSEVVGVGDLTGRVSYDSYYRFTPSGCMNVSN